MAVLANARFKIEQNDSTLLWVLSRFDPTIQSWIMLAERYATQAEAVAAMQARITRVLWRHHWGLGYRSSCGWAAY
jgi:hypothetical protein